MAAPDSLERFDFFLSELSNIDLGGGPSAES